MAAAQAMASTQDTSTSSSMTGGSLPAAFSQPVVTALRATMLAPIATAELMAVQARSRGIFTPVFYPGTAGPSLFAVTPPAFHGGMARTHITLIDPLEPASLECLEVVVQHDDGSFECAGGECAVDLKVHRFVVDCAEVECPDCEAAVLAA
jgi:hypothetical protein